MKEKVTKKNAIKAYKAFDANWTCRGFRYEVGQPYKMEGEISICQNGFHACENAADCFDYYPFDPANIKFAEVLCWGEVEKSDGNSKICCSDIRIVREMEWNEVLTICNTGDCNTGNRNTGDRNTGDCNTGDRNTGDCNTGDWNTGNRNTGDRNTGDCNTGNRNTGDCNTGNRNTGDRNTGNCNTGNWNTGDWNSGNWNSGNSNSGNWNSGNSNSGNRNTGYRNSGDMNSGDWNSGDWNSGYFNTPKLTKFFCFNRTAEKQPIDFPSFLFFDLIEWVPVSTMTDDEKNAHPECDVIGGYLKRYDYKQAFRKSFLAAKKSADWEIELAKLKAIPNFDYAIFEEISSISKEELEGR